MKQLKAYIDAYDGPKRTGADWSKMFGISRAFYSEIMSGKKRPSYKTMRRISIATDGQVPAISWFEDEKTDAA